MHTYTAFMGTNVGVYVRPWSLSIDICERKIALVVMVIVGIMKSKA